jgi:hypothetical protein
MTPPRPRTWRVLLSRFPLGAPYDTRLTVEAPTRELAAQRALTRLATLLLVAPAPSSEQPRAPRRASPTKERKP